MSRPSYVRMYDAATLRDGRGKPLHIRDAESTIAASVRDLKRSRFARCGFLPSGVGMGTNESDPLTDIFRRDDSTKFTKYLATNFELGWDRLERNERKEESKSFTTTTKNEF